MEKRSSAKASRAEASLPKAEVRPLPRRATVAPPEGRLVLADGPGNSRLFVYMTGTYMHRVERERREVYFGDLDLARVAEIIGMAGVEPGMRDAGFRDAHRNFDSVIGIEAQRAVNATSIAAALGIPRETVRRKLQQLLKLGLIVEKGRSRYVLAPGRLQEPHRQAAFARGIELTVRFMNDLLEQGVVRWVAADKIAQKSGR